jgi:CheY-like chemotaxis protein
MATLLIIDDRPIDRTHLAAVLGANGHVVVEAAGGALALEAVLGGDSLGLLAMRERAVLLGGSLDIRRRRSPFRSPGNARGAHDADPWLSVVRRRRRSQAKTTPRVL